MSNLDAVVGMLVTRVARADEFARLHATPTYDDTLEKGLAKVHDLVTAKLGSDPALQRLLGEAASGEPSPRTQTRVRMSLEDAVEDDPGFAGLLAEAVRAAQQAAGSSASDVGATTNVISGQVSGHVVQARNIQGNVNF